jgi:integrase
MRLSKETIDEIKPAATTKVYWDDALKGFGLRVTPNGVMAYVVEYRDEKSRKATKRRQTIGRHGPLTPTRARAKAKEILSQATLGSDPLGDRRKRMEELTVAQMIERWAASGALINRRTGRPRKPDSAAGDVRQLQTHVIPRLGHKRLSELSRGDIERLRDAIRAGDIRYSAKTKPRGVKRVKGGDGTATRTIAALKSALSWAVDRELLASNPAAKVKLPQSKKQITLLAPDQFGALSKALNELRPDYEQAIDIILFLALTGARKSEGECLRWDEIMPDGRTIRLSDAKTEQRVLYLGDEAAALIERQKPKRVKGNPYVFPASRGETYYQHMPKVWKLALAKAGLPLTTRRHDLRHSFATYAAGKGVPSIHLQRLLGHASITTTEIYLHAQEKGVRGAAQQAEQTIVAMLNLTANDDDMLPKAANDM